MLTYRKTFILDFLKAFIHSLNIVTLSLVSRIILLRMSVSTFLVKMI